MLVVSDALDWPALANGGVDHGHWIVPAETSPGASSQGPETIDRRRVGYGVGQLESRQFGQGQNVVRRQHLALAVRQPTNIGKFHPSTARAGPA